MNETERISTWKKEESVAHIHGWDFSHIAGRYTEETDLPWDYQRIILDYLKPEMKLLDVDTGGGEFLLLLRHPCENTSAAEAYPPNVELCKEACSRWELIFAQATERTCFLLRMPHLIWLSTVTEILMSGTFTAC